MNKKEENEHQQEGKIIFLVNSNKWDENKCFNRKLQEMKPTCRNGRKSSNFDSTLWNLIRLNKGNNLPMDVDGKESGLCSSIMQIWMTIDWFEWCVENSLLKNNWETKSGNVLFPVHTRKFRWIFESAQSFWFITRKWNWIHLIESNYENFATSQLNDLKTL